MNMNSITKINIINFYVHLYVSNTFLHIDYYHQSEINVQKGPTK